MESIKEQLKELLKTAPDVKRRMMSVENPHYITWLNLTEAEREHRWEPPKTIRAKRHPVQMDHVVLQDATTRLKFIPTKSTIKALLKTYTS